MSLICGIDEAGRGPVIGPLVIAGVLTDSAGEKKLIKLGVKDSKLLTAQQRESMFDKILTIVKAHTILVSEPSEIDKAVNGDNGLNLNWLEAQKSAEIIDELKPDIAYLDCPSPNIEKYKAYLKNRLHKDTQVVAEHKADVTYPVVSAASILAKVTRDRAIQKLQESVPEAIGSGYPSDPVTCEFLRKNYKKYHHLFRKSWMSYQQCARQQKRLDEF